MISRVPCLKQLLSNFSEKEPYSYIVLKEFTSGKDSGEVDIGGVESELISKNIYRINHIKRKKKELIKLEKGQTGLKNFGRYVFAEGFFNYVKKYRVKYRGEFDDTPILDKLATEGKLRGRLYSGMIYDTGNIAGYNEACLHFMNKK